MSEIKKLPIAIYEPIELLRMGLVSLLSRINEPRINLTEVDSYTALNDLMHSRTPKLVIVNPIAVPNFSAKEFKRQYADKELQVWALLTTFLPEERLKHYDQVLTITENVNTLNQKIQATFLPPEVHNMEEDTETLSMREKEVLIAVVQGMTNKEIADKLFLSIHTIISHRRNITRKLQINSTSGLTAYALINNLIQVDDIK